LLNEFYFTLVCHETCQTCKGGNDTECESCRPGYREEHDTKEEGAMKCVDVNECVEQRDLCPVGQYCVNTEGSYKCEGRWNVWTIFRWNDCENDI